MTGVFAISFISVYAFCLFICPSDCRCHRCCFVVCDVAAAAVTFTSSSQIAATLKSSVRDERSCLLQVFLIAVVSGIFVCSICSAVWSSKPKLRVGFGASFNFLYMWALRVVVVVPVVVVVAVCER